MGFYDEEKTAREYIAMADGYDGRDLIAVLIKHLSTKHCKKSMI